MTLSAIMNNGKVILALFGLISFFIVRRICIPRNRKWKISDVFYLGHVFVLSLFLFTLYSFCYYSISFREKRSGFNQSLWNADREKRVGMVDDLVSQKILDSKDTNAITHLLGAPARIVRDSLINKWQYYVGFRNAPFEIDPSFLIVEIKGGLVQKYYTIPGIPDIP